jgi:small subunit ribosomal protein S16
MLAIRMQRTGRKGHAMFRLVVQESRLAPTSGKVVARLGSYDPHAKSLNLDKEKASFYLEHGAQPSDRTARLLKSEGVKMPSWVKQPTEKKGVVRSPGKRRSTNPVKPEEPAAEAEVVAGTAPTGDIPAEVPEEVETSKEEPVEEPTQTDAGEAKIEETSGQEPESSEESKNGGSTSEETSEAS